jgi:spermidine/putrescine ABC transporter ATP-binding subunit
MLRSSGWAVNVKRVERIWRCEGLKVPAKQPKKGRLWLNDGSCVRLRPEHPNHVWSYDFVEDRTHAVAGIDLTIRQGEFLAILGPSGCGKTTTLGMLAGFAAPTSGDIVVDGISVVGVPPHKRNVGVVFQSYALFPHLSVFDNVAFGLRMRKVPKPEIITRVRRALDIVQLGALEDRGIRQMSGGQQQRVALARALVIEPTLLLLDEPLSNLDATLREEMRFEIREIQKRIGITTVFVTHDQGEAMAAADRLVIMNKGRIAQCGTAQDVYREPADAFVACFMGQANLLRGTVEGRSGEEASIRLTSGERLVLSANDTIAPADEVVVVMRPEQLLLGTTAGEPGGQELRGIVRRVTYLGSTVNIGVEVGEVSISILQPASETILPSVGDDVQVTWDQHPRYPHHAARRAARASAPDRHQEGLRSRPVRRLHRHRRGAADQFLPDARRHARGREVTTIEGLGTPDKLHPMQAAFVKHDGYQCGYCTPGQICSASPCSTRSRPVSQPCHADLNARRRRPHAEMRERMSGNICRCGAYSNIVDAMTEVAGGKA